MGANGWTGEQKEYRLRRFALFHSAAPPLQIGLQYDIIEKLPGLVNKGITLFPGADQQILKEHGPCTAEQNCLEPWFFQTP